MHVHRTHTFHYILDESKALVFYNLLPRLCQHPAR